MKIRVLKIEVLKIRVSKIVWKLGFWKLNLKEIGVLKIIWEWNLKKKKLNLKIGILENYLKLDVLKIKFENLNFKKLFENEI